MSENNNENMPMLSPEDAARSQKRRRIVVTTMAVAATVGILILLLAMLGNNDNTYDQDSGVVIRIDNDAKQAGRFSMSTQPGGEAAKNDVLVGTPLGNTGLSDAKEVREYYDALTAAKGWDGELAGSNNFSDEKRGSLAIVYTFYLSNATNDVAQAFRLQGKLNQTIESLNEGSGARAYEYLRLALFMGNNGSPDDTVKYYGLENSDHLPTALALDDYRECIHGALKKVDDDDGHYYRVPADNWTDNGIQYSENFEVGYNRDGLFDLGDQIIPAGASRRITFVAFLDGLDPDSQKEASKGQYLSFSLHIGV